MAYKLWKSSLCVDVCFHMFLHVCIDARARVCVPIEARD